MPLTLEAHLRRAEHVARGVKTDSDPEMVVGLAVGQRLQINVPETRAKHRFSRRRSEVMRTSSPGVVGMRVGNDSAVDGLPRIDIEVAVGAIQALGTMNNQIGVHESDSRTATESTGEDRNARRASARIVCRNP